MGRTKGWRVIKKTAEEFAGFKPPPVTERFRQHTVIKQMANQAT